MSRRRSRESVAPDLTSLIDVVFLLLIFFMVSTVFKKEELALMLNLPKTKNMQQEKVVQQQSLIVELSDLGLALNGKQISFDDLEQRLAAVSDKSTLTELRVDRDVKYKRVVKLLALFKRLGLHNLALMTDR
jgi:biopolymer transport protein ExbD